MHLVSDADVISSGRDGHGHGGRHGLLAVNTLIILQLYAIIGRDVHNVGGYGADGLATGLTASLLATGRV